MTFEPEQLGAMNGACALINFCAKSASSGYSLFIRMQH
jgi:hypothetical protein